MIIIIQCAGKKIPGAGSLQKPDGRKVKFVAHPEKAPANARYDYAHPDDKMTGTDHSWRDELLLYNNRHNNAPENNPLGLLPAWQLYANPTYALLKKHYGIEHLYILSAGWGLLRANFLTPGYDITFSRIKGKGHILRRESDSYNDLRILPADTDQPFVFFVSKAYAQLASELTKEVKGKRYLFYNSNHPPHAPGCDLLKYDTNMSTNWQYQCAKDFVCEKIKI